MEAALTPFEELLVALVRSEVSPLLKQASHCEKDRIDVLALRRLLAAGDTSA